MVITQPGKYVLTSDYDVADGHWAIRVIPTGTVVEVLYVADSINKVLTDILDWTSDDLPVEPYTDFNKQIIDEQMGA